MHTSEYKTCRIFHNGDYEGEVIIMPLDANGEPMPLDHSRNVPDWQEIRIDFTDLKDFIADYIKDKMRSKFEEQLENTSTDEILMP